VTRQVTALESAGFVDRRPDPVDRRSSTIVLTAEGRRTMGGVERERRQGMEELIADWEEDERNALGRSLHRLNVSLLENGRVSKGVD
jgi:DNA-binding MarR family transcriptional regulator